MIQLTITDKLRNLNRDIMRSSDLQSDNDLDSIRNSCDVYMSSVLAFAFVQLNDNPSGERR